VTAGTGRPASIRLACAVAIALLLVLHANAMSMSQMLWACHIASLTLAIGLALDQPKLIAIGMVFHTGQGIPAWMLDLFVVGDYSLTSTLLHSVPLEGAPPLELSARDARVIRIPVERAA